MCSAVLKIKLTPLHAAAGINDLALFKQVPAFRELDAAFYCTSAEAASLVASEVCLPESGLHYFDKARYHLSSMLKKKVVKGKRE